MENEKQIAELLSGSLKGQSRIVEQIKESNKRLHQIEGKSDRLEEQLIKLNAQTIEKRGAIFKLAEKINQIAGLHNRVAKIEKTIFK